MVLALKGSGRWNWTVEGVMKLEGLESGSVGGEEDDEVEGGGGVEVEGL